MIKKLLFISTLFISLSGLSQELPWTSFEHLNDSLRVEKKFIIIFIHTDWCKICATQENTTFQNKALVKSIGNTAYWLKLNAEQKEAITFAGKTYPFLPNGSSGNNELAVFLGKANDQPLSYPTTVILTDNFWLIKRFIGYTEAEEIMNIFKIQP